MWGEEVPSLPRAHALRQAWLRAGPTASNMMCVVETPGPAQSPDQLFSLERPALVQSPSIQLAQSVPSWDSELCEEGWPCCTSHGLHPAALPAWAGSWEGGDREVYNSAASR